MKRLLITTVLLAISISANAKSEYLESTFCEWLGEASIAVAQNRDQGIEEYDFIGKYLSEDKSYGEQSVVLPLIDRVYGIESDISPEDIAFIEQRRCEIAFVHILK